MCTRIDKPFMRFFAKGSGGLLSLSPIAFRFRPLGGATWTIDDVYLDPGHR